jgi:hypothetical protein
MTDGLVVEHLVVELVERRLGCTQSGEPQMRTQSGARYDRHDIEGRLMH